MAKKLNMSHNQLEVTHLYPLLSTTNNETTYVRPPLY